MGKAIPEKKRHARESGCSVVDHLCDVGGDWIPAYAGMTVQGLACLLWFNMTCAVGDSRQKRAGMTGLSIYCRV